MKSLIIYIAGVLTPFAILLAVCAKWSMDDWRDRRRYQRALDKFSAEFDKLTEQHLAACKARWAEEPWNYQHVCDDRGRYFRMRWQHGNTTDV